MSDLVEDFEPINAEHAELVTDTDDTKECGVCGGTTVRIGDARYFRWRGELRISEVWTCEDCRTSGNRLLCRETGRVVRLSHVHTGSGFETPDAGGELVADGGVIQTDDDEVLACPECDKTPVVTNSPGSRNGDQFTKYRCTTCNAHFDEPKVREDRGGPGIRNDSLAAKLEDAEPGDLVTDGGVDVSLNQLAGEYGVPVEARCVGCSRDDRDRVRVKLADPDVFPDDMADAGAESFKHVCHQCRKATYWNVLEVIDDVVLERVDERDEHDRDLPEKVVRFLDENGEERDDRSTYVRAGGKPLAVATDGGERQ